jgi:HD-GYP domain-containing protein (c-di-GMP phosphodiesterase class II)
MYQLDNGGAWWTTLLFGLPLFTTRVAYQRFVEMREMFTQTIGALAEAVDKRDPFTSKHSQRVRTISVDIGREMRVSASELEAWSGAGSCMTSARSACRTTCSSSRAS